MAAKPLKNLFRGAGRNALDLPVAGLAALAAAFAAFAVPQDLLSRAVVATGLPSLISAAQPPLGLTARVALAIGGAAIVFGLVFLLLRLFDRSGMREEPDTKFSDAPRVRRRDGHPDAPAPRPISAARDFGEPAPPRAPRAPVAPVPLWLDEAEPVSTPADVLELAPETAFAEAPAAEPEPEPVFAPEPVTELWPEPEADIAPEPAPAPVPEPEPAAAHPAEMPTSVAALLERLEQGLAKRRPVEPAPVLPVEPPQVFPEPQPQVSPEISQDIFPVAPEPAEPAEDRLQSAIASLQRLAARAS